MNGNIVIMGGLNFDWLNTNGSERKQFCNILETFGFVQNICKKHQSHHLLDHIISRVIISDFAVSHYISDHRTHHASMQCIGPHRVRKQI